MHNPDLNVILEENDISLDVLDDKNHKDYHAHKERIINLYRKHLLEKGALEAIAKIVPELSEHIAEIAKGMQGVQTSALDVQGELGEKFYEVFGKCMEKVSAEDAYKILEKLIELRRAEMETVKKMNKNNNFWSSRAGANIKILGAAIVGGLLGYAGMAEASSKKRQKN